MSAGEKNVSPADILPDVRIALEAVAHLTPERQQAALEAAAAIARATTEYRARMYMMGTMLTRR